MIFIYLIIFVSTPVLSALPKVADFVNYSNDPFLNGCFKHCVRSCDSVPRDYRGQRYCEICLSYNHN